MCERNDILKIINNIRKFKKMCMPLHKLKTTVKHSLKNTKIPHILELFQSA